MSNFCTKDSLGNNCISLEHVQVKLMYSLHACTVNSKGSMRADVGAHGSQPAAHRRLYTCQFGCPRGPLGCHLSLRRACSHGEAPQQFPLSPGEPYPDQQWDPINIGEPWMAAGHACPGSQSAACTAHCSSGQQSYARPLHVPCHVCFARLAWSSKIVSIKELCCCTCAPL